MKRLLYTLLCGLLLWVIENVILFLCALLKYAIQDHNDNHIPIWFRKDCLTLAGTILMNAERFVYYFPFWVLAIYFLYNKVKIKNPVMKLALANFVLYVAMLVIATFSPFIFDFLKYHFFSI